MKNNAEKFECPSRDELAGFCIGRLSLVEIESIGMHVEDCANCDSILDTLDNQHMTVAALLRDSDRFESLFADPELENLSDRAKSISINRSNAQDDGAFSPDDSTRSVRQHDEGATDTWNWANKERVQPGDIRELGRRERIGKYPVIETLGAGGFATVYLARDPVYNRRIAIKVLHKDRVVSDEAVEQLLKEARTVAKLDHPAIVQVFDWGRTDEGECYLVMEYIEGRSLSQVLKSEKLSHKRVADLIVQIASGLDYAHKREIYHRDIKPANILIDNEGKPHIADFGLAIQEADRWSHKDELAGTPAYMSPEQIRGEPHLYRALVDLWALGVILYETLTRKRPFSGGTRDQLFDDIQMGVPQSPRTITDAVPKRLETICLKSLAKQPRDRYQNAKDLVIALRRWRSAQRVKKVALALSLVFALVGATMLVPSLFSKPNLSKVEVPNPKIEEPTRARDAIPPNVNTIDLLDREPRRLAYLPSERLDTENYSERNREFAVKTKNTSVYTLRHAQEDSFKLSVEIGIDAWIGEGGIVWGLRPSLEDKGQRCFVAIITRSTKERELKLVVQELVIRENAIGQKYVAHTFSPSISEPLNVPGSKSINLEIHIDGGELKKVQVGDKPIPAEGHRASLKNTQLGIVCGGGLVVFRNASTVFSLERNE